MCKCELMINNVSLIVCRFSIGGLQRQWHFFYRDQFLRNDFFNFPLSICQLVGCKFITYSTDTVKVLRIACVFFEVFAEIKDVIVDSS